MFVSVNPILPSKTPSTLKFVLGFKKKMKMEKTQFVFTIFLRKTTDPTYFFVTLEKPNRIFVDLFTKDWCFSCIANLQIVFWDKVEDSI